MGNYRRKDDNPEEEKASIWNRCGASGCKIKPSVSAGGHTLCTYHAFKEFDDFDAITAAINKHIEHYNYIHTLTMWNREKWNKQWQILLNYSFCPLIEGEQELPHRYIDRLSNKLRSQIREDARV